jgi:hypothetical protein
VQALPYAPYIVWAQINTYPVLGAPVFVLPPPSLAFQLQLPAGVGMVVFGTDSNTVVALESGGGTQLWSFHVDAAVNAGECGEWPTRRAVDQCEAIRRTIRERASGFRLGVIAGSACLRVRSVLVSVARI